MLIDPGTVLGPVLGMAAVHGGAPVRRIQKNEVVVQPGPVDQFRFQPVRQRHIQQRLAHRPRHADLEIRHPVRLLKRQCGFNPLEIGFTFRQHNLILVHGCFKIRRSALNPFPVRLADTYRS
ncbi:hypothetical protein SDC9_210674 [bioreactor metagenome]|uniref:Uncharacterized protein n=1 Tax=bioreactor metagenome TaxID=1076179 RepID=A0A645JH32_9ZZZZ